MSADEQTSRPTYPDAPRGSSAISGISEFLGKVLAQLSLTSWLPAVLLVGNLAVLLQLHAQVTAQQPLDFAGAISALVDKPLGTLTVLLFSIIIATIVTQAFEFEIIRLLEGYFSATWGPTRWFARFRIGRHGHKQQRQRARVAAARAAAWEPAYDAMLRICDGFDRRLLQILDDEIHGRPRPPDITDADTLAALTLPWSDWAKPQQMYYLDAMVARLESYPDPARLLPSRLGNVLRAAEDAIDLPAGESLEGFVLRYHDRLPASVREEHHAYRTRLEMYCTLVLAFAALSAAAGGLLAPRLWPAVGAAVAYWLLVWVSYEAAIASARGYGDVLGEVDLVRRRLTEQAVERPPRPARLRAWLRHLLHRGVVDRA